MGQPPSSIYHLVPAEYFHVQPADRPYRPATFEQEGFIHCTAGRSTTLRVANNYFGDFSGPLLTLEIDPTQLSAPLKFEPPIVPANFNVQTSPHAGQLFPHIYGPLNRDAIRRQITLHRNSAGQWAWPE